MAPPSPAAWDSAEDRYLEILKKSLANELYLENEARLFYMFAMKAIGRPVDPDVVRNIATRWLRWMAKIRAAREEGRIWWRYPVRGPDGAHTLLDLRNVCEFSHTMIGRKRLDNIQACLAAVRRDGVPGDVAEAGVWRGGAAIFMKGCLEAWNMAGRKVWAADSFEGLPAPSCPEDAGYDFSAAKAPILAVSMEEVRDNFRRYGLLDDDVIFLKGWFRDTLPRAPIERLALLRLDCDLYGSTMDALGALYDKLSPGGFLIVDDYGDLEPCPLAVDAFRSAHGIRDAIQRIDWTGIFWRKSAQGC